MEEIKAVLNDKQKFEEAAKVGFEATDVDKSGYIDESELEKAMKEVAVTLNIDAPTKEDVFSVFEALDKDKSGKIDYQEFKVFVRKMLEALIVIQAQKFFQN